MKKMKRCMWTVNFVYLPWSEEDPYTASSYGFGATKEEAFEDMLRSAEEGNLFGENREDYVFIGAHKGMDF